MTHRRAVVLLLSLWVVGRWRHHVGDATSLHSLLTPKRCPALRMRQRLFKLSWHIVIFNPQIKNNRAVSGCIPFLNKQKGLSYLNYFHFFIFCFKTIPFHFTYVYQNALSFCRSYLLAVLWWPICGDPCEGFLRVKAGLPVPIDNQWLNLGF